MKKKKIVSKFIFWLGEEEGYDHEGNVEIYWRKVNILDILHGRESIAKFSYIKPFYFNEDETQE